ncbi:PfkB family carbohydrate kinase [Phenylobacterium soli]|uniref:pyridoxal kinase n=2 Tax=Phenylobacterium soli TaxID=2170551 RepID=A0A328AHW4_9CAUL|nr:PfkB family carbohydrate kinase [Phenylobacterium soli]RAK53656.1 pyridoxine kinase [Phenylobacterium soli]
MPVALILSSFVAASRIGGAAQQYVLAAHRIDPVLAPTVMFGRSPATGAAGEVTSPAVLRRMLADIEADAMFGMLDLVITGHFSSAAQVEIAANLLERVRLGAERRPMLIVDPIMGDAPKGLYVKPEVAEAVADRLVPLADWITPNLWELGRLAGTEVVGAEDAVAVTRGLGRPALITSVPARDGEIGILLVDAAQAVLIAHPRLDQAPNGTGDLVTACFGAALLAGEAPAAAAERAARAAAEAVAASRARRSADLPLVAIADRLVNPTAAVRVERL